MKCKKMPFDTFPPRYSGRGNVYLSRHVKIPAREVTTRTIMVIFAFYPLLRWR